MAAAVIIRPAPEEAPTMPDAAPRAEPPLPLAGVRVCDFSWIVAGPQATRILADMGAEVVKVENESYLDSMRLGLQTDPEHPSVNGSGFHSNFNRNKLSITANLHHPKGREAVERLVAKSDVVIENFSAGAFERMGLGWDRLREINPSVIYVSLSGFGHTGRDQAYVTWGPTAQAVSGVTAMSGLPDQPPAGWGFSYLDHTAGYYGAIAVLMALHHRRRTGEAQYVDMSQIETGMVLCGVPILDKQVNGRDYERIGDRSRAPAIAPHNAYRCRDDELSDRWVTIVAESDAQWRALCEELGAAALATDARFATNDLRVANQDALDAALTARTRQREAPELMYALQARGVPAGLCQRTDDKMERDPQLAARDFYRRAPHGEMGEHRFDGLPFAFSHARWRMWRGAPLLGEDTFEVLSRLLDYAPADIAEMQSELAI
jgi:crotonobetainyl-CoA:carnitine CoA-transferase CaiB-like acyl-CoA transferase